MALSERRGVFGVHSVQFYNLTTHQPVSDTILKVIGECSLNLTAEYADLLGGSNPYTFGTEVTTISPEVSLTFREYPAGFANLMIGGSLTTNAAEAAGAVSDIANVNGTSVYDLATGVTPGLTAGDYADLKEGFYTLVADSADTANLYINTDINLNDGTATEIDDDGLYGNVDFSGGAGTEILADLGLTFTIHGVTAFTIGDSMEFYVRKANTGSNIIKFGESGATFTKVGVDMYAQRQTDGSQWMIRLYKTLPAGLPFSMTEKAWTESSITFKAEYSSTKDGVGEIRYTGNVV